MTEPEKKRVTRGEDGKYRWVCEMSLFKKPTFFLLVWKIFFFIFAGVFAFMIILGFINGVDYLPDGFISDLKFLGYFLIGMTVVVGIGFLIYAAMMGGKYVVEFEMDEKGVLHRQIESQAKKAKKIAGATVIAGLATGRPSAVGAGIAASRTEMYSEFSKTKKVKASPRSGIIRIRAGLGHNQVYAPREDFDFVKDFIISHCVNLKNKKGLSKKSLFP